jgi:hypothetical protein
MGRPHFSFTERRRRKLALKVDSLDLLEVRNTITEPISIYGLSAGLVAGLSFLNPNRPDRFDVGGLRRDDSSRAGRHVATRTAVGPTNLLAFTVHPSAAAAYGSSLPTGVKAGQAAASRKAPTDSWLTASSRQRHTPGESSEHGLLSSRINHASSATAGAAQPSNRGGAPASLAARGVVTPLRFPRLDD